ncbi:hypothetical protein PVK06_026593 [Gossypium arboreum]|uniref:RNase H type-1 domain-containing protein n=1 Tax=Gossypium arboreum TaxID=29729 RepID=A0ABR0NY22_GOSAR|nr:hypothetical protein PVK06_026593 [Gossypium arboreum]
MLGSYLLANAMCLGLLLLPKSTSVPLNSFPNEPKGKYMEGTWLLGFSRKIRYWDVTRAELWALLDGLEVAWQVGYKKVEIESDSLKAIKSGKICRLCRGLLCISKANQRNLQETMGAGDFRFSIFLYPPTVWNACQVDLFGVSFDRLISCKE